MEQVIRIAIGRFCVYRSQAQFIKSCLEYNDNDEKRKELRILESKITVIEAWLGLLNADERFVVEKHLIDELEWPRIAFEFSERWKGEFTRTERSLLGYQANAIRKIAFFCEQNLHEIENIFCDEIRISICNEDKPESSIVPKK